MIASRPIDVFQEAITSGVESSVVQCWRDFAHWEHARGFADDPSHPSKAAIEWIIAWEELRGGLDEFSGIAVQECIKNLDSACEAFARLDHPLELLRALEHWRSERCDAMHSE